MFTIARNSLLQSRLPACMHTGHVLMSRFLLEPQIDPLGLAGLAFEVTNQLPVANLARFGVDAAPGRLPFVALDLVYGCHGFFNQTTGDAQCAETGFLGVPAVVPVADFPDADDSVVCRISDAAVAAVAPIAGAGGCGIQFFGNESRGGDVQIAVKALNFPFRAVRARCLLGRTPVVSLLAVASPD